MKGLYCVLTRKLNINYICHRQQEGGYIMTPIYNHKEVEKKWRGNWEVKPINVNDGKKPKSLWNGN